VAPPANWIFPGPRRNWPRLESEYIGLGKSRAALENALAVLLGMNASEFSLAETPLATEPPEIPAGLPSELLERRPDVAESERLLASQNARIGVAKAAFFPVVRLTGAAGLESGDISTLFNWQSRAWSLGPSISLPIFEGGRNIANLRRSKGAYEEAVAQYRGRVLIAFQEVEDGLSGLRILADQAVAQARSVAAAGRTADISNKRYHAGLVSYLEGSGFRPHQTPNPTRGHPDPRATSHHQRPTCQSARGRLG